MPCDCPSFAAAPIGRKRHANGEYLPRHCHREAFATVILGGGYVEAGDRGRIRVGPGDVVLHSEYESHLDSFAANGAEVLVLPLDPAHAMAGCARIADPDVIVRLAERDPAAAARALMENLLPADAEHDDWPDRLARDLRADPGLSILDWASDAGLARESVSRGFRRAYGISPVAFRATARARKALGMIGPGISLAEVAVHCGFADQAHMTRSVMRLTGHAPGHWRKRRGLS